MIIFGCDRCSFRIEFNAYYARILGGDTSSLELALTTQQREQLSVALPGSTNIGGKSLQLCPACNKDYQEIQRIEGEIYKEKIDAWFKKGLPEEYND